MTGRIRVIAGKAKGKRLKAVPGDITRPVMDRVKESLFNILGHDLLGCRFLDLFSGTGAVGIEALSRGAAFVQLNDKHVLAVDTIKQNLETTKLEENAKVTQLDAYVVAASENNSDFDYVYIAPPQYKEMWEKAVLEVDKNQELLVDDGWILVQIDPMEYKELELKNFTEFDQRKYGSTLLVFYERNP